MEQQRQDEGEGSDCLEWDHFPIHSASSSPLRRPLGSRRQSSEEPATENPGRREIDSRRVDDAVSTRRTVPNSRPIVAIGQDPSDEIALTPATRDRRIRQQGWLLESVSEAFIAQGALLGRVAAGLHLEYASERQVERGRRQRHRGGSGCNPRRQPPSTEMVSRQGGASRRRGGW